MNSLVTLFLLLPLKFPTRPHSGTADHNSYLSGSFSDSFFTSPTTPDEILNIVSSLKSSNSEGVDGTNVNVIKGSVDLLASPLSQICNISFSTNSQLAYSLI